MFAMIQGVRRTCLAIAEVCIEIHSAILSFQIPMAYITAKYLKGVYGNMAVWISLIIGQPVAILMYYVDYYLITYTG